jgi:ABC-2 type transport system permease protein
VSRRALVLATCGSIAATRRDTRFHHVAQFSPADASLPIVNAVILPLLFLSGIFIPLGNNPPAWMVWVGRVFPIKHFLSGMQAGFLGAPFHWSDVLVVAAWGLAGLLFAIRFFRWEPRTA